MARDRGADGRLGAGEGLSDPRRRLCLPIARGANPHEAFATQARLACEAAPRGVVAHQLEKLELVVARQLELIATFDDVDATRSAARSSARERDGSVVLVAHVDEPRAGGCFDDEGRRMGRLEDDGRHGGCFGRSASRGGAHEGERSSTASGRAPRARPTASRSQSHAPRAACVETRPPSARGSAGEFATRARAPRSPRSVRSPRRWRRREGRSCRRRNRP